MTFEQTKELINLLKGSGVVLFKNAELELQLAASPIENNIEKVNPVPIDAPAEVPEEIQHKVEELTSLLKMDDMQLLDNLFPDTQPEPAEESA